MSYNGHSKILSSLIVLGFQYIDNIHQLSHIGLLCLVGDQIRVSKFTQTSSLTCWLDLLVWVLVFYKYARSERASTSQTQHDLPYRVSNLPIILRMTLINYSNFRWSNLEHGLDSGPTLAVYQQSNRHKYTTRHM
jgi:hypothetical protein